MCQSFPTCTPVKRGSFHSSACQPRRRQAHRSNCEATEGRKTSANSSDSSRRCQLAAPDTSIMTIINQQAANRLYLPQQLGKSAGRLTGGAGRDGNFGETVKSVSQPLGATRQDSNVVLDAVSFQLSTPARFLRPASCIPATHAAEQAPHAGVAHSWMWPEGCSQRSSFAVGVSSFCPFTRVKGKG